MFLSGVAVLLALSRGGAAAAAGVALAVCAAGMGFVAPAHDAAALPYVQLAILAALFATFTLLAVWRGPLPWRSMDRRLGDLSYPLYLNHYIVVVALNDLTAARGLWIFAAGMAMSVALAALMGQLVDAPLRVARNRVRGQVI
jgi:peptidoglycan/LPS O-acetylase OafA/YrhL